MAENHIIRKGFIIEGMKCEGCPEIIKKQAILVNGVQKVEFDYDSATGYVTFDSSRTDIDKILNKIEEKGYRGFILDEKDKEDDKELAKNAELVSDKGSMETVEFRVTGLKCEGCPEVIKKQALSINGVKEAEFNYDEKKGYVLFDKTKTDTEKIFSKINEKGYSCFVIQKIGDDGPILPLGKTVRKGFIAEGTTCKNCEETIKKQAMKVNGVKRAEFDYSTETGHVLFDESKTNIDDILSKIEEKGYKCFILDESAKENKANNALGWLFGIVGILVAAYFLFGFVGSIGLPRISAGMGYGLLFLVGLLTGFHCVAMCGGFVVGYTAKDAQEGRKSHKSHLMYGVGKTLSYTIIGAIFGLIGSIIAFTPAMRGFAGIASGLFLVLFGLNMLNVFPFLRKVQFKTPSFIAKFVGKESAKNSSPLILGLLNGLMIACGPLQAIYIMAAGTGSMISGATLLFVFALGTLPVMLGFGYFASFISGKMTQKILKASGAIVIILGLLMLNNGLVLTGSGLDAGSIVSSVGGESGSSAVKNTNLVKSNAPSDNTAAIKDGYQEIRMDVGRSGFTPNKFVLKKGVPVKWIITGKELNGCNSGIQVPAYNLKFDVKSGEQTIEFTPTEAGTIRWSCWMGMIPGTFIVKDDIDLSNSAAVKKELDSVPTPKGGSCGGSGGGCGCGM